MKHFLVLVFSPIFMNGQSITPALNKFANSEFFIKFDELHRRCEGQMIEFNNSRNDYSYTQEDIIRLNNVYDECAGKFNSILDKIKSNLLNKKDRKLILKNTNAYSATLMTKLTQAEEYYKTHFDPLIKEITRNRIAGANLGEILNGILYYAESTFRLYINLKSEFAIYQNSIIDSKLNKYRIQTSNTLADKIQN